MQLMNYRFQLLTPRTGCDLPAGSTKRSVEYDRYLSSMQRLRGSTYLSDGAIQRRDLDQFGRYILEDDDHCWHFLLVGPDDSVVGCARYLLHPRDVSFNELRLRFCPLALDSKWGPRLRSAVERQLEEATESKKRFSELGGWALHASLRNTGAALEIVLGSYAWAALVGHCLSCCTATVRNRSASILRRIGGAPFNLNGEDLPSYFDVQYGCQMELLRFDSESIPDKYRRLLDSMTRRLRSACQLAPTTMFDDVSARDLSVMSTVLCNSARDADRVTREFLCPSRPEMLDPASQSI